MKTILVPTDFSTYGFNATRAAAAIAEKAHARLVLQHNIPTLMEWSQLSAEEHRQHPEIMERSILADSKLNELINGFPLNHLDVSKKITQGITYERIIQEAKEEQADLIVIGCHKNEKNDRSFVGSNIQKVLREAPCPVMTVNKEIFYPQWNKVVVPVSLDEDITKSFEQIREIALKLGSTIYLLFVNSPDNFKNERMVQGKMQEIIQLHPDLKFVTAIYDHEDVEAGILEYCKEINADWIGMVTHNRRNREKYLIGRTETVAYKAEIPVLSVSLHYSIREPHVAVEW